jgi:hypothetical protein
VPFERLVLSYLRQRGLVKEGNVNSLCVPPRPLRFFFVERSKPQRTRRDAEKKV